MSTPRRVPDGLLQLGARFRQRSTGKDVRRDALQQPSTVGPWFSSETGRLYRGDPTREAFRKWCKRNGVVSVRGRYAKADIDRAMADIARQRIA